MANTDEPPSYLQSWRFMPDPETASIRSAAPSYTSAAPTYYSLLDPSSSQPTPSSSSPLSPLFPSSSGGFSSSSTSSAVLPPSNAPHSSFPTLSSFSCGSTWSTVRANPTARHYHSVAHRRASIADARKEEKLRAAMRAQNPVDTVLKTLIDEETAKYEEVGHVRPLEDETLVGREAAERARRERLREWGRETLVRENKRWDWMLDQMKDWDEREKSWAKFKQEVETGKRARVARALGLKMK